MTGFILKMLGFARKEPEKADDFFAFINSKSSDKVKVMKQVLREASEEQQLLMQEYKRKALEKVA